MTNHDDMPEALDAEIGDAFSRLREEVVMESNIEGALASVKGSSPGGAGGRSPWPLAVAAVVALFAMIGAGFFVFSGDDGPNDSVGSVLPTEVPNETSVPETTSPQTPDSTVVDPTGPDTSTPGTVDSSDSTDAPGTTAPPVTAGQPPAGEPGFYPWIWPHIDQNQVDSISDEVTGLGAGNCDGYGNPAVAADPFTAGTEFVTGYLGIDDPVFSNDASAFTFDGPGDEVTLLLRHRGEGGVLLDRTTSIRATVLSGDGDCNLWAIDDVEVPGELLFTAPDAGANVGDPADFTAIGSGFEASVGIEVRSPAGDTVTFAPGTAGWAPTPFTGSADLPAGSVDSTGLVMILTSDVAADGAVGPVAVRKFGFDPSVELRLTGLMGAVTGVADNDELNMRSEPDPASEVVWTIAHDAVNVVVLDADGDGVADETNGWVEVRYDATAGWVNSNFLAVSEVGAATIAPTGQVIGALRTGNLTLLSSLAGAGGLEIGLSPSRSVAVTVTPEDLADPAAAGPVQWGVADGTGDPVMATITEQMEGLANSTGLTEVAGLGNGSPWLGSGNSINSLSEDYPGAWFVEFHSPGVDPQFEGLDWNSLILVFDDSSPQATLLGIYSNAWTI